MSGLGQCGHAVGAGSQLRIDVLVAARKIKTYVALAINIADSSTTAADSSATRVRSETARVSPIGSRRCGRDESLGSLVTRRLDYGAFAQHIADAAHRGSGAISGPVFRRR